MRLTRLATALGLLCAPIPAFADIPACGFVPGLPCATGGVGAGLVYADTVIFPALYGIFGTLALLFFFYYGIRLMLESEDESTINETKSAYTYAITGAVVVSLITYFLNAVSPMVASNTIVNPVPVTDALTNVVIFMRLMVSAAVSGAIVYSGFRLILLQGEESEIAQQKKRFFYGLIGVAIILLSTIIVNAFLPGAGSSTLAAQIVGIINFLLAILGALSILGFIVAGVMLVFSTNDELKDRAKKAIFTTVIALILVLVSYAVVKFTVNVTSDGSVAMFPALPGFLHSLFIDTAHAQAVSGPAGWVSNGLTAIFGSGGFQGIIEQVIGQIRGGGGGSIIVAVGILLVVRSGLKLINSQDEGKLDTAKRTIASTCIGVMLAFVSERLVMAFYFPGGTWGSGSVNTGASILAFEIAGVIDWFLVLLVVVGILMIVVAAVRAVGSFGKEENAIEVKQTVASVITGIGIIMLAGAVKATLGVAPDIIAVDLGAPDANIIIQKGTMVVSAVLGFLALAAVTVVIYAGIMMVFSMGDEEQYKKAKGIVIRALIGLTVVLFSVVAVNFIVGLFV